MGLKTEGEKLCFQGGLLSAAVHVALRTADPAAANELSGNDYARVAVLAAGWAVNAGTGEASNAAVSAFPAPTAMWGDPIHVGLWDAAVGGNLLASVALANDVPAPAPEAEISIPACGARGCGRRVAAVPRPLLAMRPCRRLHLRSTWPSTPASSSSI